MIPKTEYAPYFERYMQLSVLKGKTIIENLENAQDEFERVLRHLPDEKHSYSYAAKNSLGIYYMLYQLF